MPTLVLQPDAASGIDTHITQRAATTNNGTATSLNIGERAVTTTGPDRALLRFNLSGIPENATVISATLSLWLASAGSTVANNNRTLRVYRIRAGRDWVESQATWEIYKTGNSWTSAGASDTTNDREATSIGSTAMQTSDAVNSQHDFELTPSAVQDWIDGTLTNNGIIIIADTEANDLYQFCSSDHATAAQHPRLTIVYTLPVGALMHYGQFTGGFLS